MDARLSASMDGPLTIACIAQRRDQLIAWLDDGVTRIDLAAVTECDTAGVQLLLVARRRLRAAGLTLCCAPLSPAVQEALQRAGASLED